MWNQNVSHNWIRLLSTKLNMASNNVGIEFESHFRGTVNFYFNFYCSLSTVRKYVGWRSPVSYVCLHSQTTLMFFCVLIWCPPNFHFFTWIVLHCFIELAANEHNYGRCYILQTVESHYIFVTVCCVHCAVSYSVLPFYLMYSLSRSMDYSLRVRTSGQLKLSHHYVLAAVVSPFASSHLSSTQ